MLTIATILTILSSLFIIGLGLAYLVRPSAIAPGFGFVPDEQPSPFHGVKGVRDLAMGVAGIALLLVGEPLATGALMIALALVPLGDMLLVLRARGSRATAIAMHGGTALVVAATGALWLATA